MSTVRHWTSNWRGGLAITALCTLFQAPGIGRLPPVDRDEARFATASRGIATANDWKSRIIPEFDGKLRLSKPPLIYWLQAACARAFGVVADSQDSLCDTRTNALPSGGIWAYRIPSILGATGAALITWRIGLSMFASPAAWLGGVLLGCSLVVCTDGRQARTDEVLLLFTVCAQAMLWKIWRSHGRHKPDVRLLGYVVGFWVFVALGVMTKGPVTPVVAGFTVAAIVLITRETGFIRDLRPFVGLLVVVVIVSPWMIAVGNVVGWDTFGSVIWREVIGRSATAQEGHWGPPGYHILLLPILFWPGSVALAPAAFHAIRRGIRWRTNDDSLQTQSRWASVWHSIRTLRGGRDAELFCLAWIVPTWILFELASTKLPHYALPTYPAIALLCGRGVFVSHSFWTGLASKWMGRAAIAGWYLVALAISVALAPALAVLGSFRAPPIATGVFGAFCVFSVVLAILLLHALWKLNIRRVVVFALIGSGITMTSVFYILAPNLESVWLSSRAMQAICRADPNGRIPVGAVGYVEDSLVFLSHGRIERLERSRLSGWLEAHGRALLLVGDPKVREAFETGIPHELRGKPIEGWNYSKGKWVEIELYEMGRSPQ